MKSLLTTNFNTMAKSIHPDEKDNAKKEQTAKEKRRAEILEKAKAYNETLKQPQKEETKLGFEIVEKVKPKDK